MSRSPRLFLRCFLLLAYILFVAPIPAQQQQDDPTQHLTTVEARRLALAELIERRDLLEATTGNEVELIGVLNQITKLQLKFCDLDSALSASERSLHLARQYSSNSVPLLADTLTLAGTVHIRRNNIGPALSLLDEAVQLSRDSNYKRGVAEALIKSANAHYDRNETAEAEKKNDEALQIWQELQDQRGQAQTLTSQGEVYMLQDRPADATLTLRKAETMWRSVGDAAGLAATLNALTFLAIRQGQWQAALGFLNEAASVLPDKNAEPYVAGQIAMSFGLAHEAYGQLETARTYLEECLTHYRDGAHDKRAAIDARAQLARVQALLKNYAEAKQLIDENLNEAIQTGNLLNIGLCNETLGRISLEAGSYEQARTAFHSALSLLKPNTRPWARVQTYLGQTEHLLGNLDLASAAYAKALSFFQGKKISDYTNEAALRFGLGKLALQRGQISEAETQLKRSIDLTDLLRENASSDDLRSSFLDSVHNRYEAYVELLMTRDSSEPGQGLNIRAFEASESGRARALLDSLRNYQKELRQPSDPLLLREEIKLQEEEQTLVDARTKLVSEGASKQARDELDTKLAEVRANYETLQARIKSNPKFINFLRPKPLSYETIQKQVTDANTSLLSYSLGDTKSFAWVITPEGLSSFELSDRRTINDAADRLLNLLKSPATADDQKTELQKAIDQVSGLVIQPVAAKLHGSRLVVVADGLLQYVPFQILKSTTDGNDSLISRFDVTGAPSASALAVARQERINRQPGAKLVVGFGDAVFSSDYLPPGHGTTSADSTTSRSEELSRLRKLPRLFHAQRELRAIRDVAGNDSVFYTEYAATRYNLLHVDLSQFRILHVVTHGVLDTDEPELSGLVLSMVDEYKQPVDGFVSLGDIYRLRAPVDLVVLSACQTAVGRGLRGEGLIGLTRGFMYAGASGVVASLWKVDDKVTAQLMRHFYANMLEGGMGPAAALRAAQNTIRSQPQWSSPYYWAGFTFHGDYDLTINSSAAVAPRTYGKLIGGVALGAVLLVVLYWYLKRRGVRARVTNG